MKRVLIVAVLTALAVLLVGGTQPATAGPEATITFSLSVDDRGQCILTIRSSKDISNFTVNGVKTEGPGTTTLVLVIQPAT